MAEQPLPSAGGESVTRALMRLLEERERKGIETYGRSLETFNGRISPRDLVEELIDGAQYALQWEMERAELIAAGNALAEELRALKWPDGGWKRIADAVEKWEKLTKGDR